MSLDVVVKCEKTSRVARITSFGQIVVGPVEFSKFYSAEANVNDTAFNLLPPITNKQFIVTDIVLYANKGVGVNDATVELYEATAIDSITVDNLVFKQEMLKNSTIALNGLNIILSKGRWLNVKTNDNTIFANVAGYYIVS